MKKLFAVLIVVLTALTLVGCNGTKKPKKPVLYGVKPEYRVEVNGSFNPKAGITAKTFTGKDITHKITTTYDPKWIKNEGTYSYTVSVKDGNFEDKKSVKLIVVGQTIESAEIFGPSDLTYYIGSKDFEPLKDFVAYDKKGTKLELSYDEGTIITGVPGDFPYTIYAKVNNKVLATKVVTLHVKPAVEILGQGTIPADKKIEILLWHANGDSIKNALEKYAANFNAYAKEKYNLDIVVTIHKAANNYDELKNQVSTTSSSGTLPDLLQNYPDHVVEYEKNNLIASLTPYINHPIWGLNEGKKDEKFEDILRIYREENRDASIIGDYLSLPFNKSSEVLVYNRDIFERVLAASNLEELPETWDDLFALGQDLINASSAEIDRIAGAWQAAGETIKPEDITKFKETFFPYIYDSVGNAFITLTRQFDGEYTTRKVVQDSNGQKIAKGVLEFNKEENVEVRQMLEFFGKNRKFISVPEIWDEKYASSGFIKGRTFATVGSTAGVRYNAPLKDNKKIFNIGVAPIPYDKTLGKPRVIQQGTNMSIVNRKASGEVTEAMLKEKRLASWLFLKYLISSEVQEDFSIVTGYSPVRSSVYERPNYKAFLSKAALNFDNETTVVKGEYEQHLRALAVLAAKAQTDAFFYDAPFVGSSATRNAVGGAFKDVMTIEKTNPNASIETLRKIIKEALQRAYDTAIKVVGE